MIPMSEDITFHKEIKIIPMHMKFELINVSDIIESDYKRLGI